MLSFFVEAEVKVKGITAYFPFADEICGLGVGNSWLLDCTYVAFNKLVITFDIVARLGVCRSLLKVLFSHLLYASVNI